MMLEDIHVKSSSSQLELWDQRWGQYMGQEGRNVAVFFIQE